MIQPDSIGTNTTGWRPHHIETRDWTPLGRYHNISDETPTRIEVSIPPLIGDLAYEPAGTIARAHERAMIEVVRLEAGFGQHLAPLAEPPTIRAVAASVTGRHQPRRHAE
jgi:hypothetical protein